MSDSEVSVFNFDIVEEDISLPHPKKARNISERACAWTFQEKWRCSHTTVDAARIKVIQRLILVHKQEKS